MTTRPTLLLLLIGTLLLGCPLLPLPHAAATAGTITITSPASGATLYRTEGYTISGTVSPVVLPDDVLIEVTPQGSPHAVDVETVSLAANGSYFYQTNVGGSSAWTVGTYIISVSDSYGASTTTTFVYSTNGAPTSSAVSPAQSSVKGGIPLLYTATVTDSGRLGSSPSGSVSWSDEGAGGEFQTSTCSLASSGTDTSTCSVLYTPSATSSVTVTASYPGDTLRASSSGTASLTVTQDPTQTNASASPATAAPGGTVTLTAYVKDTSASPLFPAASVSWSDNGAGGSFSSSTCLLGSSAPATSSCQVTYTVPSGSTQITITAAYSGDAGHLASSGTATIAVSGGTTTTSTSSTTSSTSSSTSSGSTTSTSSTSTSSSSSTSTTTSTSTTSSSTTSTTTSTAPSSTTSSASTTSSSSTESSSTTTSSTAPTSSTSVSTTSSTTSTSSTSSSTAFGPAYLAVLAVSAALVGALGASSRRNARRR